MHPHPTSSAEDQLVWPFEKSGQVTVRSVYAFLKSREDVVGNGCASSSHQVSCRMWKNIWQIECPHKIRNFVWRAVSNKIAVASNLWKRRIARIKRCHFCQEEETIEHALLVCDWTQCVWFAVMGFRVEKENISTLDKWLEES